MDSWLPSLVSRGLSRVIKKTVSDEKDGEEKALLDREKKQKDADIDHTLAETEKLREEAKATRLGRRIKLTLFLIAIVGIFGFLTALICYQAGWLHIENGSKIFGAGAVVSAFLGFLTKFIGKD